MNSPKTMEAIPNSARIPNKTPTPQLIQSINFDDVFSHSEFPDSNQQSLSSEGKDKADWLFFDPAEYSSQNFDKLYAAFQNSGETNWNENYYLEFYAGVNPSVNNKIKMNSVIMPGERGIFEIPITNHESSWKSCWQIKNSQDEMFYEFCYNHGSGINSSASASESISSQNNDSNDIFWGFQRTKGTAPEKYSDASLSAEFISTDPKTGHTFKAYDHSETLSVSFQNKGTDSWDSSYSLVFYNGYNWMHANSFPLPNITEPGETATFTLPIEIIEDNDKWVTCWYLSTPDGKNLSDFCFNYYTRS